MKKVLILMTALLFVMSMAVSSFAVSDYYEYSTFGSTGSEFDVGSYGNDIYYGGGYSVYRTTVSVGDITKVNAPIGHADYQTRSFTPVTYINLSGAPGALNGSSIGEMQIDATSIYTSGGAGYNQVYKFNKTTGAYQGQVVTNSASVPRASQLAYGGGKWWMGNENNQIFSSTGGNWTYEFNNILSPGGGHFDGLEYAGGNLWLSDMTSNFIKRYGYGDDPDTAGVETGWNQWNIFAYTETSGSKAVEGMGYGALGHFWAGSGGVVYELGGGEIAKHIPTCEELGNCPSTPEPGILLLLGSGLVGLAVCRKKQK